MRSHSRVCSQITTQVACENCLSNLMCTFWAGVKAGCPKIVLFSTNPGFFSMSFWTLYELCINYYELRCPVSSCRDFSFICPKKVKINDRMCTQHDGFWGYMRIMCKYRVSLERIECILQLPQSLLLTLGLWWWPRMIKTVIHQIQPWKTSCDL